MGVGIALLLAVLSLGSCDEITGLLGQGSGEDVPPPIENGGTFTVTYEAGNGNGEPVEESASKGDITLPLPDDLDGFAPKTDTMVFAGWYDGKFTYKADDPYTVTDNVTFQARWGFTSADDIGTYFVPANKDKYTVGGNILLVVCDDGGTSLEKATLETMLDEITEGKTVELDLSASTFGVADGVLDLSAMSGLSVNKLILPRAATSTKPDNTGEYKYCGTAVEVSGLNVTSIGFLAFNDCVKLETANFPKAEIIGELAFWKCAALEPADFPEAKIIESYAFNGCTALKTAYFPKAENIKLWTFSYCALETITIGGGCSIHDDSGLPGGFVTAYDETEPNAVTYTLVDGKWLKTAN